MENTRTHELDNMNKNTLTHNPQAGFTLIDVSIMLAVFGVLAVTMLSFIQLDNETAQLNTTIDKIDKIENAILQFKNQYGYIPCAASRADLPNTVNFGVATDCSAASATGTDDDTDSAGAATDEVRIGVVPTRTLSLPDSYMFDKWGNRFTYAVIQDLAIDSGTYSAFTTAIDTGVIQIVDETDTQVTTVSTATITAYAIVSHGADKKGAYTKNGTLVACGSTELDEENCNHSVANEGVIFKDTEINDSVIGSATFYYDIIHYKNKADIDTESTSLTW